MNPLLNLIAIIPGARKYLPLAKFLVMHEKTVADLVNTGTSAIEAVNKTDPTIIPHLEKLAGDLTHSSGMVAATPKATEAVAKTLLHPASLSAEEKVWMDRASDAGS